MTALHTAVVIQFRRYEDTTYCIGHVACQDNHEDTVNCSGHVVQRYEDTFINFNGQIVQGYEDKKWCSGQIVLRYDRPNLRNAH